MSAEPVAETVELTHDEQARADAALVQKFLRAMAAHYRKEADSSLRDGSVSGAMLYHGYAEGLDDAASTCRAHNGQGDGCPSVTLAQTAEAHAECLRAERRERFRDFTVEEAPDAL